MSYKIEGYIAFTAGKTRDKCPYPILSSKENQWLMGWNQGKKEEEFFDKLYEDEPITEKSTKLIGFDVYNLGR